MLGANPNRQQSYTQSSQGRGYVGKDKHGVMVCPDEREAEGVLQGEEAVCGVWGFSGRRKVMGHADEICITCDAVHGFEIIALAPDVTGVAGESYITVTDAFEWDCQVQFGRKSVFV